MSLIPGNCSLCCLPDSEQPAVCGGKQLGCCHVPDHLSAEDLHHGRVRRQYAQQEADLDPVAKSVETAETGDLLVVSICQCENLYARIKIDFLHCF